MCKDKKKFWFGAIGLAILLYLYEVKVLSVGNILNIIEGLDKITIVFAFIIMLLTIHNSCTNRSKQKSDNEAIAIFLQDGDDDASRYQLPIKIIRQHLTRQEIKGYLSDLYKSDTSEKFYSIPYLIKEEFSEQVLRIQKFTYESWWANLKRKFCALFNIHLPEQQNFNEVIIYLTEANSLVKNFKKIV